MSADTSASERIRRLKARAIAVSVANGTPLPVGHGYDPVAALKLGHSAAVVETPAGPVTQPGCGCTKSSGDVLLIQSCNQTFSLIPLDTYNTISVVLSTDWNLIIPFYDIDGTPIGKPTSISGSGPEEIPFSSIAIPVGAVTYKPNIQCTAGLQVVIDCNDNANNRNLSGPVSLLQGGINIITIPDGQVTFTIAFNTGEMQPTSVVADQNGIAIIYPALPVGATTYDISTITCPANPNSNIP